jgi:hypothetical protein
LIKRYEDVQADGISHDPKKQTTRLETLHVRDKIVEFGLGLLVLGLGFLQVAAFDGLIEDGDAEGELTSYFFSI